VKTPFLLLIMLALFGCTTGHQHTAALSPDQAVDLAEKLANDKTQALYNCRPFSNGPSAQLADGLWVWHSRRGRGQLDIEATVKFASDGANPSVSIALLDNRSAPQVPRSLQRIVPDEPTFR
jgi:hypothetical protein